MATTAWKDGDWHIQRQGRSTYLCRNDRDGLTMSVETKARLRKKLAEVKAELEKDPRAVPQGCTKTRERTTAEWAARPYAERLASTNETVTQFLQRRVRHITESEDALLQAETVNRMLYRMNDNLVIDCLSRPYYDRVLKAPIEDRQEHLRTEIEDLRKRVERGYQPTTVSPLSVALEHLQHRTYVHVYNEFKSFISFYDEIGAE